MAELDSFINRVTPAFTSLTIDPSATVNYDLFSDGMRWSDEIPECVYTDLANERQNSNVWDCLRILWRYRTSLILEKPDKREDSLRGMWDLALQAFPNWPGFQETRRDPALKQLYFNLTSRAASESIAR
jgi:hypothetical protein